MPTSILLMVPAQEMLPASVASGPLVANVLPPETTVLTRLVVGVATGIAVCAAEGRATVAGGAEIGVGRGRKRRRRRPCVAPV